MKPQIFAFYLPQFHPFPENDLWWGKGFTEWTNVGKAKPLFHGHYQPRVPADLGYYDLRLPEVRNAQAEMARKYGITAFCYYHYWFGNGKQLMEMPLNEVVRTGQPDFPFFVCWANHSWYNKTWNSSAQNNERSLLIEQEYLGLEDVEQQFYTLLPIFRDQRYYRINGKLAYCIYMVKDLPYYKDYCDKFQELAQKNGLPGFFMMSYTREIEDLKKDCYKSMDANFLYPKNDLYGNKATVLLEKILSRILKRPMRVIEYKKAIKKMLVDEHKLDRVYPVILPNWDHSPRLGYNGAILHNSTPQLWGQLVNNALKLIKNKPVDDQIIMIKSWNEWAEGNYMEPDLKYGLGYLEVLKNCLEKQSDIR